MKDFQRKRVYAWEHSYIHQIDFVDSILSFSEIPAFVHKVWDDYGLEKPPVVNTLNPRKVKIGGMAQRHVIWFPKDGQWKTIVLHELAHSMTMDWDNFPPPDSCHGPTWIGLYIDLLEKYIGLNKFEMYSKASEYKVKFNRFATPLASNYRKKAA